MVVMFDSTRAKAASWMGKHMGGVGKRWADWGLSGLRKSALEGWRRDLGFFRGAGGKHQFLGGRAGLKTVGGLGIGAGVGAAVYAATDNPLLGIATGAGAMMAAGTSLKAGAGMGMKLMGPAFVGMGVVSGFQEGGIGGAVKGGAIAYGEMRLWEAGFGAVKTAFGGSMGGAGAFASTVALPLAVTAGVGYGIHKGLKYFSERGRKATKTEFAGDTAAFQTQAAYSMRQRAMQEISRSHTNSRTILGNEAQLMHLR
jgi:hypothetical protein